MGGLKGGALLLVLAIPFALFVAWQVNGVTRADMISSDVPADRGGDKERLAELRGKTAAWSDAVRKAATVVWQFRADAGAGIGDPVAAATAKASEERSKELLDLDLFLSNVEDPKFIGKLSNFYEKWQADARQAREDKAHVEDWLRKPPAITSAAGAQKAMEEVMGRIDQYSRRSKFADRGTATELRIRARVQIIDALATLADTQYRAAVPVKLPLETGTNAVKTAVDTLHELKDQIAALNADVRQAKEEKSPLPASLEGDADSKGAVADLCDTRRALLNLFAQDDLFTNATGASAWLRRVAAQYARTKDEKVRELIRAKVQEFCEAFIPVAARLDEEVIFKGSAVPRKEIVIEYEPFAGAEPKRTMLTDDPNGLNEFNLAKTYPGKSTEVRHLGKPGTAADLMPTPVSRAALQYNQDRKIEADVKNGLKWTAKSVEQLKKKCEAQKDLVDQLQAPDDARTGNGRKIWTRLVGLADGIKNAPDLFGP